MTDNTTLNLLYHRSHTIYRAEPESTYRQLSKALCGKENATLNEMLEAVEQLKYRAEPEMRPLTLEEVQKHCEEGVGATPLWMEFIGHDDLSRWMVACIPDIVFEAGNIKLHMDAFGHRYNTMWRCWPRKPTPEQMAAEKWED